MLLLITALTSAGLPRPAWGQQAEEPEVRVFGIVQEDLDRDGSQDLTIIDAAFITERDRVLVYDRANDMESATTWQEATDFTNDLWLFDAGADGQIELAIDFMQRPSGTLEAWMWDDQDADGTVRVELSPDIAVTESATPNVKVIARDGWWTRGGTVNFNLSISIDGQIQSSFTSKHWLKYVSTDGAPDFTLQVHDTDNDGHPDYQWVNAWPEADAGYGIRRSEIVVNPKDDDPPIKGSIFWPYLGSTLDWDNLREDRSAWISDDQLHIVQERSGYTKNYNVSMPPIQMLWQKRSLLYVGEFVASRFNDDSWFVYSIHRVRPGVLSSVNFEAPFAYYDLAGDDDGYPELSIRFEQYLERDMFPFREQNAEPIQVVRYSWDQDNNTAWDFKLGLIGRQQIKEVVEIGDLQLQMVPPIDLPEWIVARNWDGATFVASEFGEKWTSEGIYEWGPHGYWRDEYVTGLSSERPTVSDLNSLAIGQRGEYAFDLHRQPRLYLSSLDGKLHLVGAEGGLWRIDDVRELVYGNVGGDYLNQWTLMENGAPVETLTALAGYVIHTRSSSIEITRTREEPARFTTDPPTTKDDVMALTERLSAYQTNIEPWNLSALSRQAGDSVARLSGATLSDLRATDGGFRFVMHLANEFRATGSVGEEMSELAPGSYVVTYDGAYHTEPLTPPNLSASLQVRSTDQFTRRNPLSIVVGVENAGLTDANNLTVVVQARQGTNTASIIREPIDILSGTPTHLSTDWQVPSDGQWDIQAWLEDSNGSVIWTTEQQTIDVGHKSESVQTMITIPVGGRWRVVFLLATLSALIVALLYAFKLTALTSSVQANENERSPQDSA